MGIEKLSHFFPGSVIIRLWDPLISFTTVDFSFFWTAIVFRLLTFFFLNAHASAGTKETGKTQECNNSEFYEISRVQCTRQYLKVLPGSCS